MLNIPPTGGCPVYRRTQSASPKCELAKRWICHGIRLAFVPQNLVRKYGHIIRYEILQILGGVANWPRVSQFNWQPVLGQKIGFKQTAHARCSVADRSTTRNGFFLRVRARGSLRQLSAEVAYSKHPSFMEKWHNHHECWLQPLCQNRYRSGISVIAVTGLYRKVEAGSFARLGGPFAEPHLRLTHARSTRRPQAACCQRQLVVLPIEILEMWKSVLNLSLTKMR